MKRYLPLAVLLTSFAFQDSTTQSPPPTARTEEYQAFMVKKEWLARDGGTWRADNPSYDPKDEGSIRSFGYEFTEGYGPGVLRLRITGRVGERNYLYWEGFYYWHPTKNRTMYVAQGTGGAIASGEAVDQDGTLVFEIVRPDGVVELHRDEDVRKSDNEFVSTSYRHSDKGWILNQSLKWRRVLETSRDSKR